MASSRDKSVVSIFSLNLSLDSFYQIYLKFVLLFAIFFSVVRIALFHTEQEVEAVLSKLPPFSRIMDTQTTSPTSMLSYWADIVRK